MAVYFDLRKIPENMNHKSAADDERKKVGEFPSSDFPCYGCIKNLDTLAELEGHNAQAHREYTFHCDICRNAFPTKNTRAEHKKKYNHRS